MTASSSIRKRLAKSRTGAQRKPNQKKAVERLEHGLVVMRKRNQAQAILGRENRERLALAEEQARTLREKNKIGKQKQNRKQHERREARGTPAQPHSRCKDWMIHNGNVHYARNSSSFDKGTYTKIDVHTSDSMGMERRVLGIGKVFLEAMQTENSDKVTGLTLHDVLHIPSMPCNGISFEKLKGANLHLGTDPSGEFVAHNPSGVPMFHGIFMYGVYRLALNGSPVGESPLATAGHSEWEDLTKSLSINAEDAEQVAKVGQASREIQFIGRKDGFRPWKDGFEVEC